MYFIRALRQQGKAMTKSFQRFPLAMVASLLAAIFFHIGLLEESSPNSIQFIRWGYVFTIGFFICLNAYLFVEGLKKNLNNRNMAIGLAWILAFFSIGEIYIRLVPREGELFQTFDLAFFYFGLFVVFGIMVFFVGRFSMEEDYPMYVVDILSQIVVAFIYSVVLFMGLAFTALALNLLLGMFEGFNVYLIIGLYCFVPFMASVFLSSFPKGEEDYSSYYLFPILQRLIKYILIPLLVLYTGVLYIYLAKILFLNDLPNNSIVHLVLWSQIVSVFILFVTKTIKDGAMVKPFRNLYPMVSFPLLFLQFYALYLRINQYGITENRYLIGILGIWVFISMTFFIFNKNKENYQIIPQVLVILLIISIVGGPLSASDLSLRSQERRLGKILENNNMLRGGEIIQGKDISQKDQYEITQILSYMLGHFDKKNFELIEDDFSIDEMRQVFGFEAQYDTGHLSNSDNSLIYSLDGRKALDIASYTKMIRVEGSESKALFDRFVINRKGSTIEIEIIDENSKLQEFIIVDLNLVREKLHTLKNATYDIEPNDLAIEGENFGLAYKIYFSDLYFPEGDKDNKGNESCSFILLIKEAEEK